MKVVRAREKDREIIDYYFNGDLDNYYVLIEDDQLISCLEVLTQELVLHERVIDTSLIKNLFTVPEKQGQGYMKYLLNRVLMEREKLEMVTLLYCEEASDFKAFGFEPVYHQNEYTITRSMLGPLDSRGVRLNVELADLLSLYQFYTSYFNGYFVRNEAYYNRRTEELSQLGGRYIGVYNQGGDLRASLRMIEKGHIAHVDELIYKDTVSILKLIGFLLSQFQTVKVSTTLVEDLRKIIPEAKVERTASMVARLNSPQLFERLYNVKVKTSDSAFNAFGRPLFNSDFY